MSHRRTYDIPAEICTRSYRDLLQTTAALAAVAGLIVRSDAISLSRHAQSVVEQLEPYLVGMEKTDKWPGTQLVGGSVSTRSLYRVTSESLDILAQSSPSLFHWVNPDLPEDLHLLRSDLSPVLGSVAQEGDAWLELSGEEAKQWRSMAPRAIIEVVPLYQ